MMISKRSSRILGLSVLSISMLFVFNLPAQAITEIAKRMAKRHKPNPAQALRAMPAADFGAPLQNLTAQELTAFASGMDEFTNVEDAEGGLGPIFNNSSCVACHSVPALGGSSALVVTRFGRRVNGHFDSLDAIGGSLLQKDAIDPGAMELVPAAANVIASRQSTPLFGMGLIEAIPDEAILLNAARQVEMSFNTPMPSNAIGVRYPSIRGLPSLVDDVASGKQRIGRFGWKAQQSSLLTFAGDAYLNEMGITSRFFPSENAPNGDAARLARYDHVMDPEDTVDPATGKGDIDVAADFMRFLAPPPAIPLTNSSRAGAVLFAQTDCSGCHKPQMVTGANPVKALDRVRVNLYSDLLLHNMGKLGDGIEQGMARGSEMKTAPLWGLRASAPYLHDGRAATVDEAIKAHDGEAARARDLYLRLTPLQRQKLLEFLSSI
jgi:CxxC motif-containing protein (DUF1111 family)